MSRMRRDNKNIETRRKHDSVRDHLWSPKNDKLARAAGRQCKFQDGTVREKTEGPPHLTRMPDRSLQR